MVKSAESNALLIELRWGVLASLRLENCHSIPAELWHIDSRAPASFPKDGVFSVATWQRGHYDVLSVLANIFCRR